MSVAQIPVPARYGFMQVDGDHLYYLMRDEQQNGANRLFCFDGQTHRQISPENLSINSGVMAYGGADFSVHKGRVFFSDSKSKQWHALIDGQAKPIFDHQPNLLCDWVWLNDHQAICLAENLSHQPNYRLLKIDLGCKKFAGGGLKL